jgi:hypothetical protein
MMPEKDQELTTARRMIVEQRVGSFMLPFELVEGRPSDVMALLATTLILRCEMRGDMQAYEYSAYCPVFDPLARHGWPPRYEVRVDPDSISFVPRVPPGMAVGTPGKSAVAGMIGERSAAKPETYVAMAGRLHPDIRRQEVKGEFDWRKPVDDRNGGR